MMTIGIITQVFAWLAMFFSVLVFARKLQLFNRLVRPVDRSTPKGSSSLGNLYAFTLGMAPWAKESTRRHFLAYLRGIAFHVGIFLGLGIFLVSPWLILLPALIRYLLVTVVGIGALLGYIGWLARLTEHNLKVLSTPDDYFSVLLVSLFLTNATLYLVNPELLSVFYLSGAVMLIYAPFSKIRHCIYFAYSRLFFGRFVGSHGIFPHNNQEGR